MVALVDDIFVQGLYTIDQAAHLARLAPQSLRRWFDGGQGREPALIRQMPKNNAQVFGFLDLIQALAVRAIRNQRKLSLQKVRQTILRAEEMGIKYPFARKHQTYIFDDDVVIRLENEDLIQVTGKYKSQQLLNAVVEVYLEDLTFDPNSQLATRYTPLRQNRNEIVVCPTIQYGAPVVMPSGYTVSALTSAVLTEGTIAGAADMYDIPQEQVKLALRYEDILAGTV